MLAKLGQWFASYDALNLDATAPAIKRMNAILESYPLTNLLPYESFDAETGSYVNKGSTGFVLDCEPLTGANEETIRILASELTESLPEQASMQCLLWASPNIEASLAHWQASRDSASEIHQTLVRRRSEYIRSGQFKSLLKTSQYLVRDFRVMISCSVPGHLTGMERDRLVNFRAGLITSLRSLGMPCQNMKPQAFLNFMQELINPSHANETVTWDEERPLSEQMVHAETALDVKPDGILVNDGDWDIRSFSVREYPKEWAQWGMADLIGDAFNDKLSIPCSFVLSLNIHKPSEEAMARWASFKNTRATQQATSSLARFVPSVSKTDGDWKYATHQMEEGQKLLKGYFNVVTYAPRDMGDTAEFAVKSLFTSKGWKLMKDKYVSLQSWMATLPMMMGEGMTEDLMKFGRMRSFLSNNAANLLPLQAEWKGSTKPRMLLLGRRGQHFYWDPFDNKEGNYNVAVVGKSGTGKSVFMQELMVSILGSGGKVCVIDVGRSFDNTCHYLGGEFIEFKKDQDICINPFTHINNFEETLKILRPMFALMAAPSRKTDDYENALIEQALQATWESHGNKANVSAVADWLQQHKDKRAQDLGTMLHPYTKRGNYGRYFEGESTLDFSNPLVVLELEELKNTKDLQSVVLLTLMYHVTNSMYQSDRTKPVACIIDEAWDLLRGQSTGEFVEEGCRRARKYNGSFITGTQGVDDYYKTNAAKAAFENSDWVCLLGQKEESIHQMKESGRIRMDAHMERTLNSIKTIHGEYSEVMIKGPAGYAIGRLILDPFSQTLYSSKGEEYAAVKAIVDSGCSLEEAIEYVAKEKR